MRWLGILSVAAVVLGLPLAAQADHDPVAGLAGLVKDSGGPVRAATVYAYRITEPVLSHVTTGEDGQFLFRVLPAGVYKIIVHKSGFVPAVVLFTRAARSAADFLEFELVEERAAYGAEDDFWSIRRRIPGDVLRDIQLAEAAAYHERQLNQGPELAFETEMLAGLDRASDTGTSQLTRGRLGVHGRVGDLLLELDGRFEQLRPEDSSTVDSESSAAGHTNAVALSLEGAGRSAIQLHTVRHTFDDPVFGNRSVDLERYQIHWSQEHGPDAASAVSAQYIEESGFHTQAAVSPVGVPAASRTLRVDGSYRQEINDRLALRTGVSYQELLADTELGKALPGVAREWIDAYGIGSMQLSTGVLVEYGLYSTLLDGTVSVSPHGGLVMDMGRGWQTETVVRQRIHSEEPEISNFTLAYYRNLDETTSSEEHYYKVAVAHDGRDGEAFELGATHREIGDTLRVFFNEDFFDQVESIYLVRGDRIPELRLALSRRLAPQILTRLESSLGSGGGGLFRTGDGSSYENGVRYLVTSLDTEFEKTSTGVFLAFHRVEQSLHPRRAGQRPADVGLDKLQVKLTQELGYLLDLGTDWAVLLNVELSRGDLAQGRTLDDELHRRVAGGVAVRF